MTQANVVELKSPLFLDRNLFKILEICNKMGMMIPKSGTKINTLNWEASFKYCGCFIFSSGLPCMNHLPLVSGSYQYPHNKQAEENIECTYPAGPGACFFGFIYF